MKRILLLALLPAAFWGCDYHSETDPFRDVPFDGTGYRPVYADRETARKIEILPARDLRETGKIYLLEPYLFINEVGKGIHIINNSDPTKPEKLSFISIPSNYDMAAKGTWLYADNHDDLLVFDIADPKAVKLVKRIEKAVPTPDSPPFNNVYFECVDPSKGVVVGWEKVSMSQQPKCKR